jgi:succinate-semialdehyde dehydrogenase / glutarate-semialdehyde dehydrogenase
VFGKARAVALARAMRSGMVSINSTLTFAGFPSLPFGGVGDSGFGRIHGEDGLREFARPKAITKRRMRSAVPSTTYARKPRDLRIVEKMVRLIHSRG